MANNSITTILFDLDGTLLDTAQDLAQALNRLLLEEGTAPLPYPSIREVVSNGGNAMISLGFNTRINTKRHQQLYRRLLDLYSENLTQHTMPFPGIEALLATLDQFELSWGVVTNKPSQYTLPIMQHMALSPRCSAIVCADQVKNSKPHAEPMLKACEIIGCNPQQAIYVGDHRRDIEAGHNAGMRTVAALYGYIEANDNPKEWDADYYIDHPDELTQLLHSGF